MTCDPLVDLIVEGIPSGPIVTMNETTVQVQAEPDRANSVAEKIFGDFQGYLQTDGYAGYEALGEREGLRRLGTMARSGANLSRSRRPPAARPMPFWI